MRFLVLVLVLLLVVLVLLLLFWLGLMRACVRVTVPMQSGNFVPCAVKEGDKVLLPEFGGTKVQIDEQV